MRKGSILHKIRSNNIYEKLNFFSKSEAGVNFTKELPLKYISENLEVLLEKMRVGLILRKNPFKRKSRIKK